MSISSIIFKSCTDSMACVSTMFFISPPSGRCCSWLHLCHHTHTHTYSINFIICLLPLGSSGFRLCCVVFWFCLSPFHWPVSQDLQSCLSFPSGEWCHIHYILYLHIYLHLSLSSLFPSFSPFCSFSLSVCFGTKSTLF